MAVSGGQLGLMRAVEWHRFMAKEGQRSPPSGNGGSLAGSPTPTVQVLPMRATKFRNFNGRENVTGPVCNCIDAIDELRETQWRVSGRGIFPLSVSASSGCWVGGRVPSESRVESFHVPFTVSVTF